MKNAKQQSGETGEVAPQSAIHQAYSKATAMQDPPPRDWCSSYLAPSNTHIRQFFLMLVLRPFSLHSNVWHASGPASGVTKQNVESFSLLNVHVA